jgi:hypothetical protein
VLDLCDAQQNDRKHSLDGAYFAAGVRGLRIVSHEMPQGAHRPLPLVEVLEGSSVCVTSVIGAKALVRSRDASAATPQSHGRAMGVLWPHRGTNIEIPQSPASWPGFVP